MHTPPALTNSPPQCLDCDYWLVGLTEHRCPECGRPFNPADPTSYRTGIDNDDLYRPWLRPPSSWLNGWAAIAAYALLMAASVPGMDQFSAFWACVVGAFSGVCWLFRLIQHLSSRFYFKGKGVELEPFDRRWSTVPLLALAVMLLLASDAPLQFRVLLSRPSMDRFASDALSRKIASQSDRWIGLFPARQIDGKENGVGFGVAGTGWFRVYGELRYFPPDCVPSLDWKHLQGNWYQRKRGWWFFGPPLLDR